MPIRTLLLLSLLSVLSTTESAELHWSDRLYSHYSDQEPLRALLQSMAADQSIPLVVSERIDATVSASFQDWHAGEIFEQLVSAYQLSWYFDGNTLFVYRSDESRSTVIKLRHLSPRQLRDALRHLDLFDERFRWSADEQSQLVYFSGPPRFVELVQTMSGQLDRSSDANTHGVYHWRDARTGVAHFSSTPPSTDIGYERIAIAPFSTPLGPTSTPDTQRAERTTPEGTPR